MEGISQTGGIMIKKLDHIAIVVKDLDKEIKKYKELEGIEFKGTEVVEEQKIRAAFFKVGDIMLEIIEPTSKDSPVSSFLEKRGGGIHHLAFEVNDINNSIKEMKEREIRMIDEKPRKGAHNSKIAFVHPKSFSGVLIELKEK